MKIKRFTLLTASVLFLAAGLFTLNQPAKEKYFPRENTTFQQNQAIADGYKEYMKSIRNNRTTGSISYAEVSRAMQVADKLPNGSKTLDLNWRFRGPDNVGGRTRAIAVDIMDTAHIIAGGVSGGLWESFDAAVSWAPYDEDFIIQNVSSIAQGSDGVFYVGTGSLFDGDNDNKDNQSHFVGTGLFKLTGNGNFEVLQEPTDSNTFVSNWTSINEIAVDPNDPQRILVAANIGLQESTDGGQTFTRLTGSSAFGACYNVKISDDGKITASYRGRIVYSTDDGENFSDFRFPGSSRIELAIAPSNSDIQYALVTRSSNRCLFGVYRTYDNWANYELLQNTPDVFAPGGGFNCQGEYDSEIAVFPNNPNKILVGGIGLLVWNQSSIDPAPLEGEWKSYASNFSGVVNRNPTYVHSDKHLFVFNPENTNTLYIGSDGGVSVSFDADAVQPEFSTSNLGYNVTQFYDIAINPRDIVAGGTQDNGTQLIGLGFNTGKSAVQARGGDGFDTEMFTINPELGISSLYFGDIRRLQGVGTNFGNSTINNAAIFSGVLGNFCGGTNGGRFTCSNVFYTVTSIWESFNHQETKDSVLVSFVRNTIPPVIALEIDSMVVDTGTVYDTTYLEKLSFESKNSSAANRLFITDSLTQDLFPVDTLSGLIDEKTVDIDASGLVELIINFDTLNIDTAAKEIVFKLRGGATETRTYAVGVKETWNNIFVSSLDDDDALPLEITIENSQIKYSEYQITFAYEVEFPDIVQSTVALCNVNSGGNRDVWISKDILKGGDVNVPQWYLVGSSVQTPTTLSKPDALPGGENTISAEFSPDGNHLFLGTANGSIYRIDNLNDIDVSQLPISAPTEEVVNNITKVYRVAGLGNAAVTGIAFDPQDGNNMIVTLGNYGITSHVYRSTNALVDTGHHVVLEQIDGVASGANFLPNTPVYDAIIDRNDPNIVLVATELGVFATENAFTPNAADIVWTEENGGMGRVPAVDLEQMTFNWAQGAVNEGKIYLGTHGRGIFEADKLVGIDEKISSKDNSKGNSDNLKIYPNPIAEFVNIEVKGQLEANSQIRVFTISGQLIKEFSNLSLEFGNNVVRLDLSDLDNGTYVVQHINGDNAYAARLIKQ